MPQKLKFYLDKEGKKIYTLKSEISGKPTEPTHYKFIKVRDAPKSKNPAIKSLNKVLP